MLTPLSVGAGLLLKAATQASAQAVCPGVCVGYSTVGASPVAVPLTPGAMALLAVLLGVVALAVLRRQRMGGTWLGLVLAAVVGVGGYGWQMREASADVTYTVVLTAGTNPGTVTIPGLWGGGVFVTNSLSTPVVISTITFSPALAGSSVSEYSPLKVGSALASNTTSEIYFCPPGTLPDGHGGCF